MVFDKLAATIAPHTCIACGREGAVLCGLCTMSGGEPLVSRCAGCKVLTDNYRTCRSCRSWLALYAIYVATEYSSVYERLLREYKFACKRQAVEPIAAIMWQLPLAIAGNTVTITELPTAPKRVRQRGFDHARLLARTYSQGLRHEDHVAVAYRQLLSRQSNNRQLGASRAQRIRQMEDEFVVIEPVSVAGTTVLLVDDVITTGASLAAAARALKDAGAARVYAIVFAQKV